jgi:cellulose synthase operon protein B
MKRAFATFIMLILISALAAAASPASAEGIRQVIPPGPPAPDDDPVMPVLDDDPVIPVLDDDPANQVLDDDLVIPVLDDGPANQVLDDDLVIPVLDDNSANQVLDDQPVLPVLDEDPANQVSFSNLGLSNPRLLYSPYDDFTVFFTLPADWRLDPGAAIQLDLSTVVSSVVLAQGESTVDNITAGTLSVVLNGQEIHAEVLQGTTTHRVVALIPEGALQGDPISGQQELVLRWDAVTSCDYNLSTSIMIHPSSKLILPHESVPLTVDLTRFPYPFYRPNALDPAQVIVVVPDEPSLVELQAAMIISAGLGRLSHKQLYLNLLPAGYLNEELLETNHLILVGTHASLPLQADLSLPEVGEHTDEDGVIQAVISPWNAARLVVAASGGSDAAILKAARAISSADLVTATGEDSAAVITGVEITPPASTFTEDLSLGALAEEDLIFNQFGTQFRSIGFYIPPEKAIGAEAYLDLTYNHSELIDYLSSGIVVRLNGAPLGSIRLGDATANFSQVRFIVPPSLLRPGENILEIQVDLLPRSVCTDVRQKNVWVMIFPESTLHLPVSKQRIGLLRTLGDYPLPFSGQSDLGNTVIVVPAGAPAAWNVGANLAFDLGTATAGSISNPEVQFAGDVAAETFADEKNVILIGRPAQLPVLASLNEVLPAVFEADGALLPQNQAQVTFQMPVDGSVGYLEMAQIGETQGNALLAILGSSDEGLHWAAVALFSHSEKLNEGNFAIVQDQKINIMDLRPQTAAEAGKPAAGSESGETGQTVSEEPLSSGQAATQYQREPWILPVTIVSILIILLIVIYKIFQLRWH